MNPAVLNTENVRINTATVQIKVISVDNKQMTLAVFRQLPREFDPDPDREIPWGIVRYPIKEDGEVLDVWLVASCEGMLYRRQFIYSIPRWMAMREAWLEALTEGEFSGLSGEDVITHQGLSKKVGGEYIRWPFSDETHQLSKCDIIHSLAGWRVEEVARITSFREREWSLRDSCPQLYIAV